MAEVMTAETERPAVKLRLLANEPRLSGLHVQLKALADALDSEHAPTGSGVDPAADEKGIERWAGTDIFSAFLQDDAVGPAAGTRRWLGPLLDVVIQVLFFIPIIVTWLGLMLATLAYQQAVQLKSFAGQSFLQGWQSGFDGRLPGLFSLNHVALFIVIVITALISFILIQHFYSGKPVDDQRARLYRELTAALTAADLQLAPLRVSAPTEAATALHRATTEFARTADSIREVGMTAGKVQREAVTGLTALTEAMAKTEKLSGAMQSAAENITGTSHTLKERLGEVSTTTSAIAAAQVELVRQVSLSSDRLTMSLDAMVARFQDAITAKEAGISALAEGSASKINAALMAGAEQLRKALIESAGRPDELPGTLARIDAAMSDLRSLVSELNKSVSRLADKIDNPAIAGARSDLSASRGGTVPADMKDALADIKVASGELRTATDSLLRASSGEREGRFSEITDASGMGGFVQRLWKTRRVSLISGLTALVILAVTPIMLLIKPHPQAQTETAARSYTFSQHSYPDGLRVLRRWTLNGPGGSVLRTTLTISNTSKKQLQALYVEPILKAEAVDFRAMRFSPPPFRIIASQSVAEWSLTLDAGRTLTIHYLGRVPALGVSNGRLDHWASTFAGLEKRLTSESAALRGLRVSPTLVRLAPRQKSQLRLAGQLSNNAQAPSVMLARVIWRSDNAAVATVSPSGAVVGVGKGKAHVTAQIGAVKASALVKVS